MTSMYWLVQHVSDVPADDGWLSAAECEVRSRLWAPKRVRDWRLGRWTAKRALLRAAGLGSFASPRREAWVAISIVATETGSPRALEHGRESGWVLSLSHSGEYGLCAVARRPALVGCDVESVGRRGEEFVVDWFTSNERACVEQASGAGERSRLVTTIWSAKESALKALGVGLRMDTREVEVEFLDGLRDVDTGPNNPALSTSAPGPTASEDWSRLVVRSSERSFHGWACLRGEQVLTMVADPPPDAPIALEAPRPTSDR